MKLRIKFQVAGLIALPLLGLVTIMPSAGAHGDPVTIGGGTRAEHHGYYLNVHDDWGDEIYPSGLFVYNADDFITMVRNRISSPNAHLRLGSKFLVHTMMGLPPGNYGTPSAATLNEWESRVRAMDALGLVRWNELYDYERNTYYQGTGTGPNPVDAAAYKVSGTARSIVFRNSSGTVVYAIKHDCANPVGRFVGLPNIEPPASYQLRPITEAQSGSSTSSTASGSTTLTVSRGDSVTFRYRVRNLGPDSAPAVRWTAIYASAGTVRASGGPVAQTVSTQTYHTETFTVPATAIDGALYCRSTSATPTSDANPATVNSGTLCVRVSVPVITITATCGGATVSPADVDPLSPFTVRVTVRYNSAAAASAADATDSLYIRVTDSAGTPLAGSSNNVPTTITGSDLRGQLTFNPPHPIGSLGISYGMTGPTEPIVCNGPAIDIASKPYFQVTEGDIAAGAGMSTSGMDCAAGGIDPNPNAGIVSWNTGSAGGYAGAGVKYGGFALKHLQGFVTGQGTGYQPSQLAFGNTGAADQVDPSREFYGGQLGSLECTPDYFTGATDVEEGVQSLSTLIQARYGVVVAPGGTYTVPDGQKTVFYIDINAKVLIDVNVVYDGSYANVAAVPSFAVVARGNIYIAPSVTRLDGMYIAQPRDASSNDGIIYSCAPSGTNTNAVNVMDSSLYAACNTQLAVNGSFVSRQVWLLRTIGSVGTGTPAEIFRYTPEQWVNASFNDPTSIGVDRYDSITSLPPVL